MICPARSTLLDDIYGGRTVKAYQRQYLCCAHATLPIYPEMLRAHRGLSVVASCVCMLKPAHGAFVLLRICPLSCSYISGLVDVQVNTTTVPAFNGRAMICNPVTTSLFTNSTATATADAAAVVSCPYNEPGAYVVWRLQMSSAQRPSVEH